jgi:hypothetical protein
MLFSPVGTGKPHRVQGCFISDEEVERVVGYIKSQGEAKYSDETIREIDARATAAETRKGYDDGDEADALDPMFDQAAEAVITAGQASTTMLQKKLKLGYARASRVMDQLEERGVVGPSEGAKPRQVLISKQQWYEMQALAEGGASANKDVQLEFNTAEFEPAPEPEEDFEDEFEEEIIEEEFPVETAPGEETDDFADIYEDEDDEAQTPYAGEDGFADIYEDAPEDAEPEETITADEIPAEIIPEEFLPEEPAPEETAPGAPVLRIVPDEEEVREIELEGLDSGSGNSGEPDEPDAQPEKEEYYDDFEDLEPVSIDDVFSDDDFYDDSDDGDFFSE